MKNNLGKYYDVINPEERFKLLLAALTRGDEDEAQKLRKTCPKKHYSMSDAAYSDRLEASRDVATAFTIDWLCQEKNLSVSEACLIGVRHVLCASSNSDTNYALEDALEQAIKITEGRLKAILVAFETFCLEIEAPFEQMLVWSPYALEWVEARREQLAKVEPDRETLKQSLNLLREYWTDKTKDDRFGGDSAS